MKYNVLIPDVVKEPAEIEQAVFGSLATVKVLDAQSNDDVVAINWQNCDAILAFDKLNYDKELLAKLKKCKVLVRVGVGYDNVDVKEAKKRKIVVCNVPDYGTEEVADHTLALLLSLVRGLPDYSQRVIKRSWLRPNPIPFRLRGKILGIIGLGRIGTAVAVRAKAFGLNVLFYDPYKPEGYDKTLGITRVYSLKELAQQVEIVSVHAPLTKETENMLDKKFFGELKKDIFLINTARGAIIDLAALYQAMKKGKVKACGLDVLPVEPSDDTQQLILDYEKQASWLTGRLVVTPHVAFYSPEAYVEMRQKAAQEALRVLQGQPARNCVNG